MRGDKNTKQFRARGRLIITRIVTKVRFQEKQKDKKTNTTTPQPTKQAKRNSSEKKNEIFKQTSNVMNMYFKP